VALPIEGDVVIVRRAATIIEVIDVTTNEVIATRGTLHDALVIAAQSDGAVWQQPTDPDGDYIGEPLLLLPRVRR
jgi:hypothetical protein